MIFRLVGALGAVLLSTTSAFAFGLEEGRASLSYITTETDDSSINSIFGIAELDFSGVGPFELEADFLFNSFDVNDDEDSEDDSSLDFYALDLDGEYKINDNFAVTAGLSFLQFDSEDGDGDSGSASVTTVEIGVAYYRGPYRFAGFFGTADSDDVSSDFVGFEADYSDDRLDIASEIIWESEVVIGDDESDGGTLVDVDIVYALGTTDQTDLFAEYNLLEAGGDAVTLFNIGVFHEFEGPLAVFGSAGLIALNSSGSEDDETLSVFSVGGQYQFNDTWALEVSASTIDSDEDNANSFGITLLHLLGGRKGDYGPRVDERILRTPFDLDLGLF